MNHLQEYLSRPTPEFRWEFMASEPVPRLEMTSQVWNGIPWEHELVVLRPRNLAVDDTLILEITGGPVNLWDIDRCQTLADQSGLTVAILFNIPVQPLWDLIEDDLIAHTFVEFLDSGETHWPLLFPMTKSVIRAMDALQEFSPGAERFVTTGSSKRGWTTWLSAASGDPRIIGIMPRVIDTLNFPTQLAAQKETWDGYSEMIEPYTSRDLQTKIDSPRGAELVAMVDPYTYRESYAIPTLIVNGANDPYWLTDATRHYWEGLPQEKRLLVMPNEGHGIGDVVTVHPTLAEFARRTALGEAMPEMNWSFGDRTLTLETDQEPICLTAWVASTVTKKFDHCTWKLHQLTENRFKCEESNENQAIFIVAEFEGNDRNFTLSTQVYVLPGKVPVE